MKRFLWIVKTKTHSFRSWFFYTDFITHQWTHEWVTNADTEEELREYLNAKYDDIYSIYIKEQTHE